MNFRLRVRVQYLIDDFICILDFMGGWAAGGLWKSPVNKRLRECCPLEH